MAEEANQKDLKAALQSALQEFDGLKVEEVIRQGLDIQHLRVDRQNHNAIHELVLNYIALPPDDKQKTHMKFIDILTVLVENKLNINDGNNKNQTALHIAASSPGQSDVLRVLLAHGARVNQPDNGQQTALHKAVIHGTVDDVATLLERGADPNFVDNVGHSPIHLAVKRRNNAAILMELTNCGGKVNLNSPEYNRQLKGSTPLHTAARLGRTENALFLLKQGAHPNITDAAGQTPLHIAAFHEITGKLCDQLLKHGAKVDIPDNIFGETPLHKAVKAGNLDNIRVLFKYHANPNIADHQNNTALHKAAKYSNDLAVWQLLINNGAKLDILNINRQTPVAVAHDERNHNIMSLYWTYQSEA